MSIDTSAKPEYLGNIIASSLPIISEELFTKRYIPLLFDPNPATFNLAWINEVAANPHARVNVVNATGEILFSVPPLRVSPLTSNDPKLGQTLSYIQLEINMKGIHGVNLLDKHLPTLIDASAKSSEDYASEWRAIFDRYNLSHLYVSSDKNYNKIDDINTIVDSDDGW